MEAKEKLIPLSAVSAIFTSLTGVSRSKATVYNWARKGCRTNDGRIVKLGARKHMDQWFTTQSEIETFIQEVG